MGGGQRLFRLQRRFLRDRELDLLVFHRHGIARLAGTRSRPVLVNANNRNPITLKPCAHYPVNAPVITGKLTTTGYRFENAVSQTNSNETMLVLAFSGGGTRAALLAPHALALCPSNRGAATVSKR